MPLVRSFIDAKTKYELKYNGDIVRSRIEAVKTLMDRRYEANVAPMVDAREVVRRILEENGVPAGLHGMYYAFGFIIEKLMFSHFGATLDKAIAGLKARWITEHNADPAILDKIIEALVGRAPPY